MDLCALLPQAVLQISVPFAPHLSKSETSAGGSGRTKTIPSPLGFLFSLGSINHPT